MTKCCVRVPATSANLGPGFDCLGVALGLYHELRVEEEEGEGVEIEAFGDGAEVVPRDESNRIYQGMACVFARTGYRPGRLYLQSRNEIPLARGLGSSAAAYAAGLAAGVVLSGGELDQREIIELGVAAEGHPDNIVPAVLGGFTVTAVGEAGLAYTRLELPVGLRVVVAVPDFELSTAAARKVLPQEVSFSQAVANQARVGLLVAALATGRLDLLRTAMEDGLHQPSRAELVPGMDEVMRAALDAGALGAALSGAGPTMLACVEDEGDAVGKAMELAWEKKGIAAESRILQVDDVGLQVERNER